MGKENMNVYKFLDHNYWPKFKSAAEADDDKVFNEVLLATVRKLLEYTYDSSIKRLRGASGEEEKVDILSAFSLTAAKACEFYQAAKKEHVDIEALNKTIGERLKTTTQEIDNKNKLLESIKNNNADLLRKEDELIKKNKEYEVLANKVSALIKIAENVSPDVLNNLTSKADELEETIRQNQKTKDMLESKIKKLEETHQALSKTVVRANERTNTIEENIIDTINKRLDTIQKIYDEKAKDLNGTMAKIENFKSLHSQLNDRIKNANSDYNFYNNHLGEDSNIVKKMKGYDIRIRGIDDFLKEAGRLEDSVKGGLTKFDELIKKVIKELEEANDEISRRQKTLL